MSFIFNIINIIFILLLKFPYFYFQYHQYYYFSKHIDIFFDCDIQLLEDIS